MTSHDSLTDMVQVTWETFLKTSFFGVKWVEVKNFIRSPNCFLFKSISNTNDVRILSCNGKFAFDGLLKIENFEKFYQSDPKLKKSLVQDINPDMSLWEPVDVRSGIEISLVWHCYGKEIDRNRYVSSSWKVQRAIAYLNLKSLFLKSITSKVSGHRSKCTVNGSKNARWMGYKHCCILIGQLNE